MNWMVDWLRAWEKASRPAEYEELGSLENLRYNAEGYLEVDPIPPGADPVWQPFWMRSAEAAA